jgi:ankyrin repeat protein
LETSEVAIVDDEIKSMPAAREIFADRELAVALTLVERGGSGIRPVLTDGTDINEIGKGSITPLMWAVSRRSIAVINFLLELGADTSVPVGGGSGFTVLHWAVVMDDAETILQALLVPGVNPDMLDGRRFETPLVTSIMYRKPASLRLLLNAGANPNHVDRMGNTPLHVAAGTGNSAMVLTLLDAGTNPLAVNQQGVTFQRFLFMTPERSLNESGRAGRRAVVDWLTARGYAVEKD